MRNLTDLKDIDVLAIILMLLVPFYDFKRGKPRQRDLMRESPRCENESPISLLDQFWL